MLPLEGIRILDTTRYLPGPLCTMLLGDMGADIIKIEETEPKGAEFFRSFPELFNQLEIDKKDEIIYAYNMVNRNKKSICLNLKNEEGRNIFYRLVEQADVVVIESRPGVSKRLGIDYETLNKINVKLIHCEISAFGQIGPYSNIPAHDPNLLGISGILGITGTPDGQYVLPGIPIGDCVSGLLAVIGILIALQTRQKTGRGQFVDVSMLNGLLYLMAIRHGHAYFSTGYQPRKGERPVHVYQTSDGKHLVIAPPEPWMWGRLCRALDMEQFIPFREKAMLGPVNDPICEEICSHLTKIFKTKTRDEWFKILAFETNICATPVYDDFEEVFVDPQVRHQEMLVHLVHPILGNVKQIGIPIKFSETPGSIRSLPPKPGQQTNEILTSLGYSYGQIEHLRNIGAIA